MPNKNINDLTLEDIDEKGDDKCTICLENLYSSKILDLVETTCIHSGGGSDTGTFHHRFHGKCLEEACGETGLVECICPNCRGEIISTKNLTADLEKKIRELNPSALSVSIESNGNFSLKKIDAKFLVLDNYYYIEYIPNKAHDRNIYYGKLIRSINADDNKTVFEKPDGKKIQIFDDMKQILDPHKEIITDMFVSGDKRFVFYKKIPFNKKYDKNNKIRDEIKSRENSAMGKLTRRKIRKTKRKSKSKKNKF